MVGASSAGRTDFVASATLVACSSAGCAYGAPPSYPPPPPPTLANGGFEHPLLAAGGGAYRYRPSDAGWTFTGASGVQRNGSAWGAATAPEGTQAGFLQNVAAIAQNIDFPAGDHVLSFRLARRAYASPSGQRQSIRVTVEGAQIGTVITPSLTSFAMFSMPFTIARQGVHLLRIEGLNASGDATVFIDSVTVTRPQ